MTPEQALQLLDNASALAAGTRKDHAAVQEAVAVLKKLIDSTASKDAPASP